MTDWEDRIVDSALHELGGSRPPDLTARVLIALEEGADENPAAGSLPLLLPESGPQADQQADALQATRTPGARRGVVQSSLLAAAFLCLGMLTAYAVSYVVDDAARLTPDSERVALQVAYGEVEFVPAGSQRPGEGVLAGEQLVVRAGTGARLFAADHSRFRLGAFPVLRVEPATELEVRSMGFSVQNGVVAATSLTIGVVVGMVTWDAISGPTVAASGEEVRLTTGSTDRGDQSSENARLLARVRELEAENQRLANVRKQVAAQQEAPEQPPKVEEEVQPATASLAFDDPKYADVLSKINWKAMGKATFEIQPMLNELVKAVEEGGEIPTDLAVKIEQLNTHLVGEVPTLLEAGLPGTGPNGAYTHPLVVANTLASTLEAAGQPLDAAQSAALQGLVRSFGAELDGVAAGQYEFASETMLHELEAKDRFYKEMSQRLTPEQFAAIYPEGSTEFDGLSLFGSGLVTRHLLRPIKAANASDFARRAGNRLADELGFDDANTVRLRQVLESVAGANPGLWGKPATAAERKLKFLQAGRTMVALANQVAMLREVALQFQLTPEQQKKLFSLKGVMVPLY